MAITITANLDASGVRAGATQAADAIDGMATQAERSGDSLEQFAAEVQGDINALRDRTRQLKAELASMGDTGEGAFQKLTDGAEQSAKAVDKASERRDKIQTIAVSYLAVADAAKKAFELGKKVVEVVDLMAENGNPAAKELSDSFGQVKASLLEIAEDPAFQDMLADVAGLIRDEIIPLIKAIPDAWVQSQDWLEDSIAGLGESLGIFTEGTREAMDEMQAADAKSREIRQKQMAADKEAKRLAEEAAKAAEEKAKADEKAAKEAEAAAKERQQHLKEMAREEEQSARERERLLKEEQDARKKAADDELKAFQKFQQAKLDAERKSIDDRKRLLTGNDVRGAEQVLGAQSAEQVRQAFANRQANQAAAQAQAGGADEREIAKQRQRALQLAQRQWDRGQANPEEVRKAQEEFANAAISAQQQQGNLSKESAQALREGIRELAANASELERVTAEIENIKKITQGVVIQGQRRRAQVAGAGR